MFHFTGEKTKAQKEMIFQCQKIIIEWKWDLGLPNHPIMYWAEKIIEHLRKKVEREGHTE